MCRLYHNAAKQRRDLGLHNEAVRYGHADLFEWIHTIPYPVIETVDISSIVLAAAEGGSVHVLDRLRGERIL